MNQGSEWCKYKSFSALKELGRFDCQEDIRDEEQQEGVWETF